MTRKPAPNNNPARKLPDTPLVNERVADERRPSRRWPETLDRPRPVLRFTPTAWAKLEFFRDRGETEIGGFGITAPDDLLLIEEFVTVRQAVTCVSVAFEDAAVADLFEAQVDAGRKPEQFGRVWLHTHPGNSPIPSGTDERTFADVFGRCDWAVMFVLAQEGKSYARLRFNVGPGGQIVIPTEIDFALPFVGSDQVAWAQEYDRNIHALSFADSGVKSAPQPAESSAPAVAEDADRPMLAVLEHDLGPDEPEDLRSLLESGVWL